VPGKNMHYAERGAMKPHQAAREGFPWIPWVIAIVVVLGTGIWLLTWLLSPAVNGVDSIAQRNEVNHLKRQQAVNNQQYQNTTQSQQYQDNLVNGPDGINASLAAITGPGGIAATRLTLAKSDPEQANLRAQEMQEITSLCEQAQKLNPSNSALAQGDPTLKAILAANCQAGGPVQNPPLALNPVPDGGA
jgi:cytoskeletal protein RodZ